MMNPTISNEVRSGTTAAPVARLMHRTCLAQRIREDDFQQREPLLSCLAKTLELAPPLRFCFILMRTIEMKHLVSHLIVVFVLLFVGHCLGDEPSLEPIPLPMPNPIAGRADDVTRPQTAEPTVGPELQPATESPITESPAVAPSDKPAAATTSHDARPQSAGVVTQTDPAIRDRRVVRTLRLSAPATVRAGAVPALRPATVVYDLRVNAYPPVPAIVLAPVPPPILRRNALRPANVATYRVAPNGQYVPLATPVLVRPKYYLPGQPVRNLIRAVTP